MSPAAPDPGGNCRGAGWSFSSCDTPAGTPVPPCQNRIILHLDMDCFYAAVEIRKNPDLACKPVIVGPDPRKGGRRGVVLTCSYEARAFGVHSAMPVTRALALCPHATFVPPDFPAYAGASRRVMEILGSFGFPLEQVSIDEAFLDISTAGSWVAAHLLADEVRVRIREGAGLSCSVGLGPSRAVAKIASDFRKPGGLTVVDPAGLRTFLDPLPVRKIPGVGKKAEALLFGMGIRTIGDLARCDPGALTGRFGKSALSLYRCACGIETGDLRQGREVRSISKETTFASDTDDPRVLQATLASLASRVCANLEQECLRCRTVTLKLRYEGFVTRSRSRSLPRSVSDSRALQSLAGALFHEMYEGGRIRLMGIRLSMFERTDAGQTTLPV